MRIYLREEEVGWNMPKTAVTEGVDTTEEKQPQGCEVRLDRVSKTYIRGKQQVAALNQVSLTVPRGEFLAIMGASGCGKSTLLNLVAGLDKPSAGEVYLNGQGISGWKDNELTLFRRREIGFVFQFFNLLPTLTAEENAALPLLMAGKPRLVWQPQVSDWLKRVGLDTRHYHYPAELSGGQMQRVAIVRALINQPSLILADEPTGNLDSKTGEEVLFILKEMTEDQGITVIMVTHDPKVAAYGSALITMKDGQILDLTAR